MDMSMGDMVDPAIANLPLSDPNCIRNAEMCTAFYAAENASQDAIPFASQFEYGHWVSYYYVGIIGLLFLWQLVSIVRHNAAKKTATPSSGLKGPSVVKKVQAVGRMVFYRRSTLLRGNFAPPSYGTSAFLLVAVIFLIGLVFTQRPYYRDHLGYGSPPIAIRSGLMAFACIPVLVALAGKVNFITLFTGISHERLNVMHRAVAWFTFVLSLVHGIPFFIASYQDEGWGGSERVYHEFYSIVDGAGEYSGVVAFGILFGLCIFSLPQVRNWCYEGFYALHIALAITFVGLCFWHSIYEGEAILDSWYYLYVTVAIWAASIVARVFWKTQSLSIKNQWFDSWPADIREMPGSVTRIEVSPRQKFHWTPGQYVFLRFLEFAPLETHPFTIASVPSTLVNDPEKSQASTPNPLVFIAKSHKGFTRRLLHRAQGPRAHVRTKVYVDGPYGGINKPIQALYDHVVLVAAGSGVTALLPWLTQIATEAQQGARLQVKRVTFIWVIKTADAYTWIESELRSALQSSTQSSALQIEAKFYITGSENVENQTQQTSKSTTTRTATRNKTKSADIDIEERSSSLSSDSQQSAEYIDKISALGSTINGRPVFPVLLDEVVREGEKTMILGSGPEGFSIDLANAVAGAQKRVISGRAAEIALHTEVFGW